MLIIIMKSELFELSEKVVLVTGSNGALAGAAAEYLLHQGVTVIFLSRNEEKIKAAVERARKVNPAVLGFGCDVTDAQALAQVAAEIKQKLGRLDGLVNAAGGNMPGAVITPEQSIFDLQIADYDKVFDLNLKGTLLPTLAFGQLMVEQGHGSIINFSSASAAMALTRVIGYSNAKAAVDNLTRWLATEFAQRHGDGMRVNAVCPGFFIGEQNRALLMKPDGVPTERGQKVINKTPMGRFGEAEEICGALHFLLSDAAKFVTGQIIHVDGGFGVYSGV